MKKFLGGCLKLFGIVFVLLIVLAFGCRGSDKTSGDAERTDAVEETADEQTTEEQTTEEQAAEEQTTEEQGTGAEEESPEEEAEGPSATDAGEQQGDALPADYIRPEFQQFCDSYLAFYREYADFMQRYNENPSDVSALVELSGMLEREADMVEAMDGWEAEDLTEAEHRLYVETSAEALRISADLLGSMG